MKTNTTATQKGLIGRIEKLENDVQAICATLAELIATLKSLPEPPCPPMCGFELFMEKKTGKKRGSRKR